MKVAKQSMVAALTICALRYSICAEIFGNLFITLRDRPDLRFQQADDKSFTYYDDQLD